MTYRIAQVFSRRRDRLEGWGMGFSGSVKTFTLADMLDQLEQVDVLGSFKSVVKLIPSASAMLDQADFGDELKQTRAMIYSMTPAERNQPEIIDDSRRRRIARGSGTDSRDVDGLLKQHRDMEKMMGWRDWFDDNFRPRFP